MLRNEPPELTTILPNVFVALKTFVAVNVFTPLNVFELVNAFDPLNVFELVKSCPVLNVFSALNVFCAVVPAAPKTSRPEDGVVTGNQLF